MKKINTFLSLLCVILIILIQQKQNITIKNKEIQNINISETYINLEEALIASKVINKEILVIFETEWCLACKKFKKDSVIAEKELNNYIVCFLDIDKDKDVAKKYNVKVLPYYLILNKNGELLKQGKGYKNKIGFINWLKDL